MNDEWTFVFESFPSDDGMLLMNNEGEVIAVTPASMHGRYRFCREQYKAIWMEEKRVGL